MASFADLLTRFAGQVEDEPNGLPPSQRTGPVAVFGYVSATGLTIFTPGGPVEVNAETLAGFEASRKILILPRDPLPADIKAGTFRLANNTVSGRLSWWANDGGTMVDLLTFTPVA